MAWTFALVDDGIRVLCNDVVFGERGYRGYATRYDAIIVAMGERLGRVAEPRNDRLLFLGIRRRAVSEDGGR